MTGRVADVASQPFSAPLFTKLMLGYFLHIPPFSSGLPPAALTVVNGSKGHVMLETTRLAFLITALQGQKYQGLYSIPRYGQVINKHVYLNKW